MKTGDFEKRAKELVAQMTCDEKMEQLRHEAPAIERLGVPEYNWWNEGLHGMARSGVATVFPQSIGMAASFDTELLKEVASAISDEARAKYNECKKFGRTLQYEGLNYFSPNINIFRDPRWGRGHETYGEDPLLTGKMGTAYVKGLQGEGKYRKVDATLKHYAVHSGPESKRHEFDAKVSEKDLDETYLSAFKYCIEHADPSAVMGAYNRVEGEPCCASKKLLGEKLFDEFGFQGYVVSDCGAIYDISENHHYAANETEGAAEALNNGCHLNCGGAYKWWLKKAFEENLVDEETITKAAEKLFTARFRLGMFDEDCEYDKIPYSVIECKKHRELNRKMAQESMVLLKNDGILPLKNDIKTIAVIGPNADRKEVLLGNYNGTPSRYATLLRGIQDGCDAEILYSEGCRLFPGKGSHWVTPMIHDDAVIAAKKADVVILCMGLTPQMEGEAGDAVAYNEGLGGDKKDLELPATQRELIQKIMEVGKPVIFVNVSGSCINLSYEKEHCNAIIQCFYPGAEGGNALADILFGRVSPSGRLPVTFYESTKDLPDFEDYSMENRTYKFYKGTPVYEFGFGLSYSEVTETYVDDNTVILENRGTYDVNYSLLKFEYIPHKNLCNFKKVFVKAGEKLVVKFDT